MNADENQIVVYQPNETIRLDVSAEIIPGLLASISRTASKRCEYGKPPKSRARARAKFCDPLAIGLNM